MTGNFYAPDHIEDCIYVGDLYGTMYRVDSIGKGQTPSASKLFKFNPYPSGPDERPIRGKASIAYNEGSSGLWVYYGTGRYETAADKVNNQQQYFFGLKDAATPRATPYSVADLTTLEARFTAATIGGKAMTLRTINGSNTSANPWAMKLFAGQSGWGGPATSRRQRARVHQAAGGGRDRVLHHLYPGCRHLHRQRRHLCVRVGLQDGNAPERRRCSTSTGTAISPTPTRY